MTEKIFKLKGKTLTIIDWANVYGWTKKLKWEVNAKKLYDYLKTYPEIYDIRFYFGIEKGNRKSEGFQEEIKRIGYSLISKEVKWIPVSLGVTHFKTRNGKIKSIAETLGKETHNIFKELLQKRLQEPFGGSFCRRKCDFDVEVTMDMLNNIKNFDGIILFSGDGDYKAIVEHLLENKKQVTVVHPFGLRGREYNELLSRIGNRPYFCAVEKLTPFLKKNLPE